MAAVCACGKGRQGRCVDCLERRHRENNVLIDALRHYADEASWELEDDPGPGISTAYYPTWFYHGDGTGRPPWEVAQEALNAR